MNLFKFLKLFFLTMALVGCSVFKKYKTPTNEDVFLDSSLILVYDKKLADQERFKAPFIASYNYGDKNLVYVAALHTDGTGNTTHQTILKAIADFKPNFIILAGSAYSVISDPDDIKYAKRCLINLFVSCDADAFTIIEAQKSKIPFSYGDPSDASIHSSLKKRFITDEELISLYALRNLNSLKEKNLISKVNWNEKLGEVLVRASKKFRASSPITEDRFKKIFKSKMGKNLNFDDLTQEMIRPQVDDKPSWSNKLAYALDSINEQFLVKQIETKLNKYKKILVVYEVSHLIKHREMLRDVFGESIDQDLNQ